MPSIFKKENLKEILEEEDKKNELKIHNILVVDDEESNLVALRTLLSQNYNVETAINAEVALEILRNTPEDKKIHMIITDQKMPEMNGSDFLEKSILITPESIRIIVTGFSDIDITMDAINKGNVYKFLIKPYGNIEILQIVKRGIEVYELKNKNTLLIDELRSLNNGLEGQVVERTKELLETNDRLNQFIGIVAHDLRNPLGNIHSFAEVILDDFENSFSYVERIKKISENSLGLVNDLLDISAIESGKINLECSSHNLSLIAKETLEEVEFLAKKKDINLELSVPNEISVNVDKNRIMQVLGNLLTNAIKFTPQNGKVILGVNKVDGGTELYVQDNGIGIPEDIIGDLFNTNINTSRSGTEKEKGTGFGLPLSQSLVMAHNSDIKVESQTDSGSKFYFILPDLKTT